MFLMSLSPLFPLPLENYGEGKGESIYRGRSAPSFNNFSPSPALGEGDLGDKVKLLRGMEFKYSSFVVLIMQQTYSQA